MTYNVAVLVFIFLIAWRGRDQMVRAWRFRGLFRPGVYWGIALLYVLSGSCITFAAFGAPHLGISLGTATTQSVSIAGIISLLLVRLIAGRIATSAFERDGVQQADRNDIHGLWMMFWLLGVVVGCLPIFMPRAG